MNIVFDDLRLDDKYRKVLAPLLPNGKAHRILKTSTDLTDDPLNVDEGFVFLTNLDVGVLQYHTVFFESNKDAPQWFFVLLNKQDKGLSDLRNAALKHNLKNAVFCHAGNITAFEAAIRKISRAKHVAKGKVLLLSKHKRAWTSELAKVLFEDESKYEIMDSANISDTDSETLLLCGERIDDFKGFVLPRNMEPYFILNVKGELQHYISPGTLIRELADYHHITIERVESRLYFVDVEGEMWLANTDKTNGDIAVSKGILLWDRFGLPRCRSEYTKENIEMLAKESHKYIEKLNKIIKL